MLLESIHTDYIGVLCQLSSPIKWALDGGGGVGVGGGGHVACRF